MSEIDVYGQHLTSWLEAHDNYSRGMLAFVEGTTEKSRLLDALKAQKNDLNRALLAYLEKLNENGVNFKSESELFKTNCCAIIKTHNQTLQKNTSYWYTVSPGIRHFIGVICAIPSWPFLLLSKSLNQRFSNTFFNQPLAIYDDFFRKLNQHVSEIRPLDCIYPINYDDSKAPLMNISDAEWKYAKRILMPNGVIVADGTKIKKSNHPLNLTHSFIVINGIIFAKGTKKDRINKDYNAVRLSKDEFGRLWALKKFTIYTGDHVQKKLQTREENASQDLQFATKSATRLSALQLSKSYLPCVYLEGKTLPEYLKINPSPDQLKAVVIKILQQVQKLHENKLSVSGMSYKHGDLHAGNIIIGDDDSVKIIDFGRTVKQPEFLYNDIIDLNKYILQSMLKKIDLSNRLSTEVDAIATKVNSKNVSTAIEAILNSVNEFQVPQDTPDASSTATFD